jgi:alkanesulfonate monooxygenase SsuD/methylene tetrahydromethanopterin reductase-like flavin-dependent oxidoreductase (luciferase family)
VEIQLGVVGFGELARYSDASVQTSTATRKLEEFKHLAKTAEAVGLDVFGVGEHHRAEFAISSPPVVLAALAEHTRGIRLASVLTVLASDDPVRVLEQFATLDALSGGRAELYVGRDSFPEAFTLFGHRLIDDDDLLEEKLALLLLLARQSNVSWRGKFRAPLRDVSIAPEPSAALTIGVTTDRSRRPVELAARWALPLTIHMRAGHWQSYEPLARLYRQRFDRRAAGLSDSHITVLIPAHIAETYERATDLAAQFYGSAHARMLSRDGIALEGPMIVGHPGAVVEQLSALHAAFRPQRILFELGRGNMPMKDTVRAVELFGDQVAAAIRADIAGRH